MIAAELADIRRYLLEVPPHHGEGARAALADRSRRLERELAAAGSTPSQPPTPSGDAR